MRVKLADDEAAANDGRAEPASQALRHLQAVAEFGQYALRETDLDALLHEACAQVAKGLGVPYAKVLEYRAEENDVLIRAGVGWRPGVVGSVRAPASRDHAPGLAIQTRQPVVSGNLAADPRFNPTPLFREYRIAALANAPILLETGLETGVFGVLEVVTPEPHPFSTHEVTFLQNFANLIASVIHRRRSEESLKAALAEREILLRELQHRVKNNLYVVTSLLGLQANRIGDSAARRALEEVQHRVHAIGLAYGLLQTSQDISHFDLGNYLAALCRTLIGDDKEGGIALALDLEPALVTLQIGVPLGLIVNELVSNSLQHAFPERRGTISLKVRRDGEHIALEIADDGQGMAQPAGTRVSRSGSLGLKLVEALALQVQGILTRPPAERGVRYHLTFTVPHE